MEKLNGIRITLYRILLSILQKSIMQRFKCSTKVIIDEITTLYFPIHAKLFSWLEKIILSKNLTGLGKMGV